jgi:predicted mannosyl-3-phosphoglycerate phosphatase (HAD superfamily)
MINNNLDTLITYSLDPACVIGQVCKIHKHKHIEIINKYGKTTKMQPDYTNENFDLKNNYFISESGQIFYSEKETTIVNYNFQVPKVLIRFSDTLKLNDLKHLKQGDTRSASELVALHPIKETIIPQNDLNAVCLGVEFSFMLVCTSVYLFNSFNDWFAMFSKIKFALKS